MAADKVIQHEPAKERVRLTEALYSLQHCVPSHRDHLPQHDPLCKVVNHMLLCRCARDWNDSSPRESESTVWKQGLDAKCSTGLGTASVTGKHLFYECAGSHANMHWV